MLLCGLGLAHAVPPIANQSEAFDLQTTIAMLSAACPTQQSDESSCPLIRTMVKHTCSRSEEKMPLTTHHNTSTEVTSAAKQEDDGDLRRASMVSTVPSTVADDSTIRSSAGGETLPKSAISSSSSSAAAAIPEKKKLLEDESRVVTTHITRSARLTPAPTPAQALTISTSSPSVSFGSVKIISFPIVLSDNPGGKLGGPSIGLGPKPLSIHPNTLDLDIYEIGRAGKRRKPGTMLAPPSIRYVSRCCISESSINPAF